ncbi:MAG: DMT family transporter [Rhizobiaceae bacterium]
MRSPSNLIVRMAPMVFVLLWATGFVGAKYGTSDAEPFTFLAIRFAITFFILLPFILLFIPRSGFNLPQILHSMIIGCFIQALYLGGIFYAIDRGMAAGISSLVVALQPFFTAVFAFALLGERNSLRKVGFFLAALAGVGLVLFPDLDLQGAIPGINVETLAATIIGTLAISFGAVYQKRNVTSLNLWVSTTAQFAGAAMLTGLCAYFFEEGSITWSNQVIFSLAWLIFVLSIGAVALLMYLIRKGDTSSVASLFFLVPVVALFMSWVLFGEALVPMQFAGSALVVISVALASRKNETAHR